MERIKNESMEGKGANIEIILHVLRHGDRTPEGYLEEYGRKRTRDVASENGENYPGGVNVKSFGSPAGPKSPETIMARSEETADIYGRDALVYMALVDAGVSIY